MSLGWFDTEAYYNANDVTKYKEVMIVFFAGQGTTTGYEKFKTLTAFSEHQKTADRTCQFDSTTLQNQQLLDCQAKLHDVMTNEAGTAVYTETGELVDIIFTWPVVRDQTKTA